MLIKGYSVMDALGEGRHMNVGASVELPEVPHSPDYVRMTVFLQSGVVEKNPHGPGTMFTEIRSQSLNGSIPFAIMNFVTAKIPKEKNW